VRAGAPRGEGDPLQEAHFEISSANTKTALGAVFIISFFSSVEMRGYPTYLLSMARETPALPAPPPHLFP